MNIDMETILFLSGLPASGKSTFGKQYCIENPNFKRINKDDIRKKLGNKPYSKEFEKEVLEFQRQQGLEYINDGFSIIVDDTNFSKKHSTYWKDVACKHGLEFRELFMDTPLEVCIERDSKRQDSVGKDVILRMYNNHLNPLYNE